MKIRRIINIWICKSERLDKVIFNNNLNQVDHETEQIIINKSDTQKASVDTASNLGKQIKLLVRNRRKLVSSLCHLFDEWSLYRCSAKRCSSISPLWANL